MGFGIGGVMYISDVTFDEGVGAGNTFLVEGLIAPFALNGAKMRLKTLPITLGVNF